MNNFFSMLQQFNQFKQQLQQTGKNPAQILEELIKSGRVSQDQVNQAKNMAELVQSLIGGKKL